MAYVLNIRKKIIGSNGFMILYGPWISKPSLAFDIGQVVGRDAYNVAILFVPPANTMREVTRDLLVKEWEP